MHGKIKISEISEMDYVKIILGVFIDLLSLTSLNCMAHCQRQIGIKIQLVASML